MRCVLGHYPSVLWRALSFGAFDWIWAKSISLQDRNHINNKHQWRSSSGNHTCPCLNTSSTMFDRCCGLALDHQPFLSFSILFPSFCCFLKVFMTWLDVLNECFSSPRKELFVSWGLLGHYGVVELNSAFHLLKNWPHWVFLAITKNFSAVSLIDNVWGFFSLVMASFICINNRIYHILTIPMKSHQTKNSAPDTSP